MAEQSIKQNMVLSNTFKTLSLENHGIILDTYARSGIIARLNNNPEINAVILFKNLDKVEPIVYRTSSWKSRYSEGFIHVEFKIEEILKLKKYCEEILLPKMKAANKIKY